jgi:hypothetical protein
LRLEKVEKNKGFSNKIPEGAEVQKGDCDIWGDLF